VSLQKVAYQMYLCTRDEDYPPETAQTSGKSTPSLATRANRVPDAQKAFQLVLYLVEKATRILSNASTLPVILKRAEDVPSTVMLQTPHYPPHTTARPYQILPESNAYRVNVSSTLVSGVSRWTRQAGLVS
jgi:hypothetical protein